MMTWGGQAERADPSALEQLEVKSLHLLATVDDAVERRDLVGGRVGWQPQAIGVVALRRFDFDDLGAPVGKHAGAGRAGQQAGQVENADASERLCHAAIIPAGPQVRFGSES